MPIIINPGTEPQTNHSLENANESVRRLVAEFSQPIISEFREERDGFYRYTLRSGDRSCEIEVPGCEPDRFEASKPFYSPRMYVDGSSWLRGYGVGFVADALFGTEEDE